MYTIDSRQEMHVYTNSGNVLQFAHTGITLRYDFNSLGSLSALGAAQ